MTPRWMRSRTGCHRSATRLMPASEPPSRRKALRRKTRRLGGLGASYGLKNDGRDLVGLLVEREMAGVGDLDEGHVRSRREQLSLRGCDPDVILLAEDDPGSDA